MRVTVARVTAGLQLPTVIGSMWALGYAAMGSTLTLMDGVLGDKFDKDVMEAALKAMFNNTFFYGQTKPDGTPDTDSEGILVKVNTKTGEMKLLYPSR